MSEKSLRKELRESWGGLWKCSCGMIGKDFEGHVHPDDVPFSIAPYERRAKSSEEPGLRDALEKIEHSGCTEDAYVARAALIATPVTPNTEECANCHGSGRMPKGSSQNAIDRMRNFLAEPPSTEEASLREAFVAGCNFVDTQGEVYPPGEYEAEAAQRYPEKMESGSFPARVVFKGPAKPKLQGGRETKE